jgi:signal transduction histidine kinase
LQQYGVTVRTCVDPGLTPVLGDRMQLQQVLLNLVINAIQSMSLVHDRPRELVIRCEGCTAEDGVLIAVEDSGTGFDPSIADRMFDSMFTTKTGGMGMGLSISRSIIAAHGGRIWGSPHGPAGAAFRIILPAARGVESESIPQVRASQLPSAGFVHRG